MNTRTQKIIDFFLSPLGKIIAFVVIFYLMTFLVYYFYSPGPEARRMAQTTQQQ